MSIEMYEIDHVYTYTAGDESAKPVQVCAFVYLAIKSFIFTWSSFLDLPFGDNAFIAKMYKVCLECADTFN